MGEEEEEELEMRVKRGLKGVGGEVEEGSAWVDIFDLKWRVEGSYIFLWVDGFGVEMGIG